MGEIGAGEGFGEDSMDGCCVKLNVPNNWHI